MSIGVNVVVCSFFSCGVENQAAVDNNIIVSADVDIEHTHQLLSDKLIMTINTKLSYLKTSSWE